MLGKALSSKHSRQGLKDTVFDRGRAKWRWLRPRVPVTAPKACRQAEMFIGFLLEIAGNFQYGGALRLSRRVAPAAGFRLFP
jgi:hypothetical protein